MSFIFLPTANLHPFPPQFLRSLFFFCQAAARLAAKTQGDARAALEAEKQTAVAELQQQLDRSLQDLEDARRSQAEQVHQAAQAAQAAAVQAEEEARLERDRLVREAEDAAKGSAAAVDAVERRAERAEATAHASADKVYASSRAAATRV